MKRTKPMTVSLYRAVRLLFPLLFATSATAELLWAPQPPADRQQAAKQADGHTGHGGRGPTLYLHDARAADTIMWSSNLERLNLPIKKSGKAALPRTGIDNYHVMIARRHNEKLHESAIRYLYRRGKPSGHSPSELTRLEKLPLEIVPDPLPREHRRYIGAKEEQFVVRFQGEPLAGVKVDLETTNGTQLEAKSDAKGRVRFAIPDDFSHVVPGRRNNPPAEMIVRTDHTGDGVLHRVNLSAPYYASPTNWKSFNAGLFMLGFGFFAGVLIVRRDAARGGTRV